MKGPFNSFQEALLSARRLSEDRGVEVEIKHQDVVTTEWFIDWVEPQVHAIDDDDFDDQEDPFDDPDLYKYAEDPLSGLYEYEAEEARREISEGSPLGAYDYAHIEETGWFED